MQQHTELIQIKRSYLEKKINNGNNAEVAACCYENWVWLSILKWLRDAFSLFLPFIVNLLLLGYSESEGLTKSEFSGMRRPHRWWERRRSQVSGGKGEKFNFSNDYSFWSPITSLAVSGSLCQISQLQRDGKGTSNFVLWENSLTLSLQVPILSFIIMSSIARRFSREVIWWNKVSLSLSFFTFYYNLLSLSQPGFLRFQNAMRINERFLQRTHFKCKFYWIKLLLFRLYRLLEI